MNIELWRDWLWPGVAMAIAVTVALFTHWLAFTLLGRLLSRGGHPTDDAVLRRSRRPAGLILPVLAGMLVLSDDRFPQAWWRSQDSVDTPFPGLVSSFELIRADTADVAMPA